MARVKRKSPTAHAYQLDDDPKSQRFIINFGKGFITHGSGNSVAVLVSGQYITAMPGDYVLSFEDEKRFEVISEQDFKANYELL